MKPEKKTTLGAAYGVAFGVIIGVLTDNIGLWLSLGIAIGCGVGSYLDQQEKGNTNDPKSNLLKTVAQLNSAHLF